eukprot:scaffold9774_cov143-Isochrysis_galbana.AAC.4
MRSGGPYPGRTEAAFRIVSTGVSARAARENRGVSGTTASSGISPSADRLATAPAVGSTMSEDCSRRGLHIHRAKIGQLHRSQHHTRRGGKGTPYEEGPLAGGSEQRASPI